MQQLIRNELALLETSELAPAGLRGRVEALKGRLEEGGAPTAEDLAFLVRMAKLPFISNEETLPDLLKRPTPLDVPNPRADQVPYLTVLRAIEKRRVQFDVSARAIHLLKELGPEPDKHLTEDDLKYLEQRLKDDFIVKPSINLLTRDLEDIERLVKQEQQETQAIVQRGPRGGDTLERRVRSIILNDAATVALAMDTVSDAARAYREILKNATTE